MLQKRRTSAWRHLTPSGFVQFLTALIFELTVISAVRKNDYSNLALVSVSFSSTTTSFGFSLLYSKKNSLARNIFYSSQNLQLMLWKTCRWRPSMNLCDAAALSTDPHSNTPHIYLKWGPLFSRAFTRPLQELRKTYLTISRPEYRTTLTENKVQEWSEFNTSTDTPL